MSFYFSILALIRFATSVARTALSSSAVKTLVKIGYAMAASQKVNMMTMTGSSFAEIAVRFVPFVISHGYLESAEREGDRHTGRNLE